MDLPALAEANALAGNAPDAAGLEYTIAGPELEALEQPVRVAVDGQVHAVAPGERFKVKMLAHGARGYVAVEGGLVQPRPGEPTRALAKGEVLMAGEQGSSAHRASEGRAPEAGVIEVRALIGPQADHFHAPERFFETEYLLTPQSDRRGLRLRGTPLHLKRADIPPEGTAPGAVQIPGDGQPIVLGPDRPVTGGYPKIATVISADFPQLAQARPGARIRFRQVSLADALRARR
jgi:allophanate hydrolase subunit 2